jgi:hypothetical protein
VITRDASHVTTHNRDYGHDWVVGQRISGVSLAHIFYASQCEQRVSGGFANGPRVRRGGRGWQRNFCRVRRRNFCRVRRVGKGEAPARMNGMG